MRKYHQEISGSGSRYYPSSLDQCRISLFEINKRIAEPGKTPGLDLS
jgi:hypothetical protein